MSDTFYFSCLENKFSKKNWGAVATLSTHLKIEMKLMYDWYLGQVRRKVPEQSSAAIENKFNEKNLKKLTRDYPRGISLW